MTKVCKLKLPPKLKAALYMTTDNEKSPSALNVTEFWQKINIMLCKRSRVFLIFDVPLIILSVLRFMTSRWVFFTDVENKFDDRWIPFNCFRFRVFVVAHWHTVILYWNTWIKHHKILSNSCIFPIMTSQNVCDKGQLGVTTLSDPFLIVIISYRWHCWGSAGASCSSWMPLSLLCLCTWLLCWQRLGFTRLRCLPSEWCPSWTRSGFSRTR